MMHASLATRMASNIIATAHRASHDLCQSFQFLGLVWGDGGRKREGINFLLVASRMLRVVDATGYFVAGCETSHNHWVSPFQ